MEPVALIMIQFLGVAGAPKIDIGRVPVGLEECRAWIREFEPAPPGRRAYCAKVRIEWYDWKRNCWRENCAIVPG